MGGTAELQGASLHAAPRPRPRAGWMKALGAALGVRGRRSEASPEPGAAPEVAPRSLALLGAAAAGSEGAPGGRADAAPSPGLFGRAGSCWDAEKGEGGPGVVGSRGGALRLLLLGAALVVLGLAFFFICRGFAFCFLFLLPRPQLRTYKNQSWGGRGRQGGGENPQRCSAASSRDTCSSLHMEPKQYKNKQSSLDHKTKV